MKEFDVRKIENNILITYDIDWGKPLEILLKSDIYVVVRRKGHRYWSGIGLQSFANTFYALYRLDKRDGAMKAIEIERDEPGHNWRSYRSHLFHKCRALGEKKKS